MESNEENRKGKTRWFVEPRDHNTNESAMMDLARLCRATEDMIFTAKKDIEGESHPVVEVERQFVARMARNSKKFRLNFRVYTQTGNEDAMKLWNFDDAKTLKDTTRQTSITRKPIVNALDALWPSKK